MGLAMFVGAVESGAVIVRYTVFLWLSLLLALAPAIVAAGEEWLFRSRANRWSPGNRIGIHLYMMGKLGVPLPTVP